MEVLQTEASLWAFLAKATRAPAGGRALIPTHQINKINKTEFALLVQPAQGRDCFAIDSISEAASDYFYFKSGKYNVREKKRLRLTTTGLI